MEILIDEWVFNTIYQYYDDAILAHPNTYTSDDAHRDWDRVSNEVCKVGTKLRKVNPNTSFIISRWNGFYVDCSDKTGWYFAYKIEGNIIHVYDAVKHDNMDDKAYIPNKNRNTNIV